MAKSEEQFDIFKKIIRIALIGSFNRGCILRMLSIVAMLFTLRLLQ